ncbi:hypothetical protein D8895_12935 [Streptococcus sp. BCA20]|uniref:Uncharacterized protein n=1 Tax=Streptococcus intermedius TaxID=1338 RepID=A0AAD1FIH1_STRIT|nr:hypothetical protein [Streptococcus intermedius]RSJ12494.1 hypothetical protein D8895_12935 [Streptococcus sp. BCA20]BAW16138.1 hypothetical protein SITYG_01520 [Streptococcus intermedius]
MKSENPYKVAYAQYTTKTVAPHISTTNVVEIEHHQDNIGNGMRATGEFVHSAFETVAENPVQTIAGIVIGGCIIAGLTIGVTEVAVGAGAMITYLLNLFSDSCNFY